MHKDFDLSKNNDVENYAFIDGQNLYISTAKSGDPWKINLARFRIYLKDKYKIKYAYYFLGYKSKKYTSLYNEITESGFILQFKQHGQEVTSLKKGNIDSDIIFKAMERIYYKNIVNQVIIVSGDGDYKNLVDFLIKIKKFKKILFPNRKYASSLYKSINREYYDYIENYQKVLQNKKDLKH